MKLSKNIIIISSLFACSAFAAEEITRQEAAKHNYVKVGNISVTEEGFSMTDADIGKKVDEKGGKYYVIIAEHGEETHKTIRAIMYK
ncbi:DUF1471 domain-containing protein [Serratia microhaemolytica]|uniref:DUF1471 domain-containing protein n=1 Tax=Serratia microhaemolytica TaxID=2675110 RepID=UPI000FDCE8DB|nr:DUF1471 domain-containing protein [Serratia microhaemolytica]